MTTGYLSIQDIEQILTIHDEAKKALRFMRLVESKKINGGLVEFSSVAYEAICADEILRSTLNTLVFLKDISPTLLEENCDNNMAYAAAMKSITESGQ